MGVHNEITNFKHDKFYVIHTMHILTIGQQMHSVKHTLLQVLISYMFQHQVSLVYYTAHNNTLQTLHLEEIFQITKMETDVCMHTYELIPGKAIT
jgi:hypothetical protein